VALRCDGVALCAAASAAPPAACPVGCLIVALSLPIKSAVCTNYRVVSRCRRSHAARMIESTFDPPSLFAAILGVIAFVAFSEALLGPHR
jgi:hypothetical protein